MRRTFKAVYAAGQDPELVSVPDLQYLMIDGQGDPATSADFQAATQTLYPVAYALKFRLKARGLDCKVMPLEGLWWMGEHTAWDASQRADWRWTLMIAVPDEVAPEDLEEAIAALRGKKPQLPSLAKLRFEVLHEGQAAQIMHLGPYAEEGPTLERLHGFIRAHGWQFAGKHHEIYLGDPRKSAGEALRTILRQPVREA